MSRKKIRLDPIYLGLDLSLNSTGWCFLNADGSLHSSGLIKSRKGEIGIKRLQYLRSQLIDLITKTCPGSNGTLQVCIENYAMGIRGGRSFNIGEWGGIARVSVAELPHTHSVRLISPTALKKFVVGKGVADKSLMLLCVYKIWNESFTNDDECDAFSLAKACELINETEEEDRQRLCGNKIKRDAAMTAELFYEKDV